MLQQHRNRRTDTAPLRAELRAPAVHVSPGTVEAAVKRVQLVPERLALVKCQKW